MGVANKVVTLYQSVKINGKWTFRKVPEQRLRRLSEGKYHVSWYEGSKKKMEPVGAEPDVARAALTRKQRELEFVATGGRVSNPEQRSNRNKLLAAVEAYVADCRARQGQSGYSMAKTTVEAYRYRLGFLTKFQPDAYVDEVDLAFVKSVLKFLQAHPKKLDDRTCYNVMQATSTFLRTHGITVAGTLLRQMSFPPKPVIPYSDEEMTRFFKTCNDEERLIFKFFLHSMAREREVAFCEVRDLLFEKNVVHISPKPDRGFRLKGKRSGQAKNGRKVPIPSIFMSSLKQHCSSKAPRELVLRNGQGGIENHFLRRCENIAKRAGFANWQDFDLHRWRKTEATRHHEHGVSVRKIQAWLGHESLDVTLAYLGVEGAADEYSQEQVNTGALAAFA
jgi:integrase